MPLKISIVLPVFNEQKIIKNSLTKIHNWIKIKKYYYEIVVVNDGSTDQSLNVLKNLKTNILLLLAEDLDLDSLCGLGGTLIMEQLD